MVEPSACVALKAEHWLVVSDVALAGSILEAELVLGDCHHGGLVPAGALGGGRSRTGGVAALCLVDHVGLLGHNSHSTGLVPAAAGWVFLRGGVGLFALYRVRHVALLGHHLAELVLGHSDDRVSTVAGALRVFLRRGVGLFARRISDFGTRAIGGHEAVLVLGDSSRSTGLVPAGAGSGFLRGGVGLGTGSGVENVASAALNKAELVLGALSCFTGTGSGFLDRGVGLDAGRITLVVRDADLADSAARDAPTGAWGVDLFTVCARVRCAA